VEAQALGAFKLCTALDRAMGQNTPPVLLNADENRQRERF
jgi:hypothetical protein